MRLRVFLETCDWVNNKRLDTYDLGALGYQGR